MFIFKKLYPKIPTFIIFLIHPGVKIRANLENLTAEDELLYTCEFEITKDSLTVAYTGQGFIKVFNDSEIQIHTFNSPFDSVELGK